MTEPIQPKTNSGQSRIPPALTIAFVALFFVGLGLLLSPLVALFMISSTWHAEAERLSGTVTPANAAQDVATSLVNGDVFGTLPYGGPDYKQMQSLLTNRITGLNGFKKRGGWPHYENGADWYEVELTPNLAVELREQLSQSTFLPVGDFPPNVYGPPDWWPKSWPADAQCYTNGNEYFVLQTGSTRAWFMREAQ